MRVLCVGHTDEFVEDVISRWSSHEDLSLKILIPGNKAALDSSIVKYPNIAFNYFPNENFNNSSLEIDKFEANGFSLSRIIRSDRVLRTRNYEEALNYCKNVIALLVEEINLYKPTLIFSTFDNAHSGLSFLVANFFDIKWSSFYFTAVPKAYVSISNNPFEMDKIFCSNGKDWSFNDSLELIKQAQNDTQNVYMFIPSYKLLPLIKNLVSRLLSKNYNKFQWTTITERFIFIVKKTINKINLNVFLKFQKRIKEELNQKYVLYLLQMSPESTVDVWATEYMSQIQVIEDISINLPVNYKLYLKIHPSDPGALNMSNLRKIKSLGNIHIVSHKYRSVDYIKNSELVSTVTGTAALESFIHSVPSLMFGKHFYCNLSGINYFNSNRVEFGHFLRKILSNKFDLSLEQKAEELTGLMRNFKKIRLNNWKVKSSKSEVKLLLELLIDYMKK